MKRLMWIRSMAVLSLVVGLAWSPSRSDAVLDGGEIVHCNTDHSNCLNWCTDLWTRSPSGPARNKVYNDCAHGCDNARETCFSISDFGEYGAPIPELNNEIMEHNSEVSERATESGTSEFRREANRTLESHREQRENAFECYYFSGEPATAI